MLGGDGNSGGTKILLDAKPRLKGYDFAQKSWVSAYIPEHSTYVGYTMSSSSAFGE